MTFEVLVENKVRENLMVYHDAYNKSLSGKHISHEWVFINHLYKAEIKKDPEIAIKFMMFVVQFYPHYRWVKFDLTDPIASVVLECYRSSFFLENGDIISESERDKTLKNAMDFGNIATEFLIRFLNYSLINCQGQKIIITARSNCDKLFVDDLLQGYALQRMAKIVYTEVSNELLSSYPKVYGYFRSLPVLPTKKMDIEIEELIETPEREYVNVK